MPISENQWVELLTHQGVPCSRCMAAVQLDLQTALSAARKLAEAGRKQEVLKDTYVQCPRCGNPIKL